MIPKENLTRIQQKFIGTTFETPKGGILTVVGVSGERRGSNAVFILECSICSLDTVLWPYGRITSVKGSLLNGRYPCGCTKIPKWTRKQYEILIKRKCTEKNYVFQGFVGEWLNQRTYLKLHNITNVNTWDTTTIDNFLNHGNGCPLEGINKLRIPQSEREQQIVDRLSVEGGTFVGWMGKYKNNHSKFNWVCNENHDCTTSISGFINLGTRCRTCHKIKQLDNGVGYGYYPDRVNEPDHLYIIHFKKGNYIKVGRAFDVDARLKGSTGLLKSSKHNIKEIEILAVFTGVHQDIYNTEQWIHGQLTERGFYHPTEWTTETFDYDCKDVLFYLLNKTKLTKLADIVE